jgi:hypothetical protein
MKNSILLAALAMTVQPAFAGQSLTFDQLKDACKNPAKYHSQIQPTGIKVECADRQLSWGPAAEDAFALPAERMIGFSISSDKYTVPMTRGPLVVPAMNSACPAFKQVEETIAVSESFTCDQLLAFEGTATELCTKLIDQMRTDNPAAIIRKDTGKEVHLCQSAPAEDRGQREQRKEEGERGQRGQRH